MLKVLLVGILVILASSQTSRNPADLFLLGKRDNDAKTLRFQGLTLSSSLTYSPSMKRMRLSTPLVLSPHEDDGYYLLFDNGEADPPGFFVTGSELRLRATAGGSVVPLGDFGGGGGVTSLPPPLVLSRSFLTFSQLLSITNSRSGSIAGVSPPWGLDLFPLFAVFWDQNVVGLAADELDIFDSFPDSIFGNTVRNGTFFYNEQSNHEEWPGESSFFSGQFTSVQPSTGLAASFKSITSFDFRFPNAPEERSTPWISLANNITSNTTRALFDLKDSGNGVELVALQGNQADLANPVDQVLELPQRASTRPGYHCVALRGSTPHTCTFTLDEGVRLPYSFRIVGNLPDPTNQLQINRYISPVLTTNNRGGLDSPYTATFGRFPTTNISHAVTYSASGRVITVTVSVDQASFASNPNLAVELTLLRRETRRVAGNTGNNNIPIAKIEPNTDYRMLFALAPIQNHVRRGDTDINSFNPWLSVVGVLNGVKFGPIPLNKRASDYQITGFAIAADANYLNRIQRLGYNNDPQIDGIDVEGLYTRISDHFGAVVAPIPLGLRIDTSQLFFRGSKEAVSTFNNSMSATDVPRDVMIARVGTDSSLTTLLGNRVGWASRITVGTYSSSNGGQRSVIVDFGQSVWNTRPLCRFAPDGYNGGRTIYLQPTANAFTYRHPVILTNLGGQGTFYFWMICGGQLR